jgi:hypothetical protein
VSEQTTAPLRVDDLYRARQDPYSYYLRFGSTGIVESISADNGVSAADVERSLVAGSAPPHARGRLEIYGTRLAFSLTSDAGSVDYEGVISPEGDLIVETHSRINDRRETGLRCEFVATTDNELVREAKDRIEVAFRLGGLRSEETTPTSTEP